MLIIIICACLVHACTSQRYAERNVLPADTFPSSDDGDEYAEGYGFEDEEASKVYKWNVEEYPHPRNNSRFCNRLKPSHVCDPDMILTKEHADSLDSSILKIYKETPCICDSCSSDDGGIVVGIALLKHTYQDYNVHPVKVIRHFAETLRSRWRLGKCDNDILIVVATTDRLSYTDVGEAASSYLSVHEAHRIFVANRAQFTAGNFFEGLRDILEGYYKETRIMESPLARKKDELNFGVISGAIIGSILLLGILLFVGFVLYRKYRINKDDQNGQGPNNGKGEGIYSSWSKKDIKVLFGSEKSKNSPPLKTEYQPCQTADTVDTQTPDDGEEVIDFTLATPDDISFANETQETHVTMDSEALDKDLTTAAEGIVKTFPAKSETSILMTDM